MRNIYENKIFTNPKKLDTLLCVDSFWDFFAAGYLKELSAFGK